MSSAVGRYIQDDLSTATAAAGIFPGNVMYSVAATTGATMFMGTDGNIYTMAAGGDGTVGASSSQQMLSVSSDILQSQDSLVSGVITSGDLIQLLGGNVSLTEISGDMQLQSEEFGPLAAFDAAGGISFQPQFAPDNAAAGSLPPGSQSGQ